MLWRRLTRLSAPLNLTLSSWPSTRGTAAVTASVFVTLTATNASCSQYAHPPITEHTVASCSSHSLGYGPAFIAHTEVTVPISEVDGDFTSTITEAYTEGNAATTPLVTAGESHEGTGVSLGPTRGGNWEDHSGSTASVSIVWIPASLEGDADSSNPQATVLPEASQGIAPTITVNNQLIGPTSVSGIGIGYIVGSQTFTEGHKITIATVSQTASTRLTTNAQGQTVLVQGTSLATLNTAAGPTSVSNEIGHNPTRGDGNGSSSSSIQQSNGANQVLTQGSREMRRTIILLSTLLLGMRNALIV